MSRLLPCLAIALAALIAMPAAAFAAAAPPIGGTLQSPDLWQAYKSAFVSPGGRVVDNANGDISHSEGQGYAMLLAVAADDRSAFDEIWGWTRAQLMLREDGLAAWKWDPAKTPHAADRNNATDGDLLITWALAEAGDSWSSPAYKTAALEGASAIVKFAVADSPHGPVLKPGVAGFG